MLEMFLYGDFGYRSQIKTTKECFLVLIFVKIYRVRYAQSLGL